WSKSAVEYLPDPASVSSITRTRPTNTPDPLRCAVEARRGLPGRSPAPRSAPRDRRERFGVQARAADEETVDVWRGEERLGVVRFDGPAVQDRHLGSAIVPDPLREAAPQAAVGVGGILGGGVDTGPDCPDGLVGEDHLGNEFGGDALDGGVELSEDDLLEAAGLALLE